MPAQNILRRTDWITANGVDVRIVVREDEFGHEYVELEARGNLEDRTRLSFWPSQAPWANA